MKICVLHGENIARLRQTHSQTSWFCHAARRVESSRVIGEAGLDKQREKCSQIQAKLPLPQQKANRRAKETMKIKSLALITAGKKWQTQWNRILLSFNTDGNTHYKSYVMQVRCCRYQLYLQRFKKEKHHQRL